MIKNDVFKKTKVFQFDNGPEFKRDVEDKYT